MISTTNKPTWTPLRGKVRPDVAGQTAENRGDDTPRIEFDFDVEGVEQDFFDELLYGQDTPQGVVRYTLRAPERTQTTLPPSELVFPRVQANPSYKATALSGLAEWGIHLQENVVTTRRLRESLSASMNVMMAGHHARISGTSEKIKPAQIQSGSLDLIRRQGTWFSDIIRDATDLLADYEGFNRQNWDGDGAEPITPDTLRLARSLIRQLPTVFGAPTPSPGLDGSIALEWAPETKHRIHKLFLDIGPGEKWRAYWRSKSGEFGRHVSVSFDARIELQKLFEQLS